MTNSPRSRQSLRPEVGSYGFLWQRGVQRNRNLNDFLSCERLVGGRQLFTFRWEPWRERFRTSCCPCMSVHFIEDPGNARAAIRGHSKCGLLSRLSRRGTGRHRPGPTLARGCRHRAPRALSPMARWKAVNGHVPSNKSLELRIQLSWLGMSAPAPLIAATYSPARTRYMDHPFRGNRSFKLTSKATPLQLFRGYRIAKTKGRCTVFFAPALAHGCRFISVVAFGCWL